MAWWVLSEMLWKFMFDPATKVQTAQRTHPEGDWGVYLTPARWAPGGFFDRWAILVWVVGELEVQATMPLQPHVVAVAS